MRRKATIKIEDLLVEMIAKLDRARADDAWLLVAHMAKAIQAVVDEDFKGTSEKESPGVPCGWAYWAKQRFDLAGNDLQRLKRDFLNDTRPGFSQEAWVDYANRWVGWRADEWCRKHQPLDKGRWEEVEPR